MKAKKQRYKEIIVASNKDLNACVIELYDKAAEILLSATKCSKGCIDEAFYNLGIVRIAQTKYKDASICFQKSLVIAPEYKEAKQQLKDVTQLFANARKEINFASLI